MIKKIVIASVLKPVDDVRAYSKIAQSLAKTNKYEVNIIGNESKKGNDHSNILFHPHKIRRSSWIARCFIQLNILSKSIKIKPSIFIFTTYELIFSAILIRWFTGCKLVYDVQENYSKNVRFNKPILGKVISPIIQLIEYVGKKYIALFVYAEKCYQDELTFPKHQAIVIENKAQKPIQTDPQSGNTRILFSGTVSNYSGAELAMKTMKLLIENDKKFEGVFIGQVHDHALWNRLRKEVNDVDSIELILSEKPIPHQEILHQIQQSRLGIISYQPNEVNRNKVPTKLYEYSRYRLPFLVQKETYWQEIGETLGGAIPFDFNAPNGNDVSKMISNSSNLFPTEYPLSATWEVESLRIVNSIDQLV